MITRAKEDTSAARDSCFEHPILADCRVEIREMAIFLQNSPADEDAVAAPQIYRASLSAPEIEPAGGGDHRHRRRLQPVAAFLPCLPSLRIGREEGR